jgi:4'-phosphopantetheinyl transferase
MVYIKRITEKKEYGKGYHILCHNEGIKLLEYALSCEYPDYIFSEDKIKKGYRGKPYIEEATFHFNISHADGIIICAVSETEIGADAESIREVTDRVMKRCYSGSEIEYVNSCNDKNVAFTRLWTLKESYVKLTGEGVATDLKSVCFDLINNTAFSDNLSFSQLLLNDRYIISVCRSDTPGKVFCKSLCSIDEIITLDM